jgi:hypothetical protein
MNRSEKSSMKARNFLNNFVCMLTGNPSPKVPPGCLLGPIRVPGNADIPNNVDLFVGRADADLDFSNVAYRMN